MRSAAACLSATPGYLSPEERCRRALEAEHAAKRDLDTAVRRHEMAEDAATAALFRLVSCMRWVR